MQGRPGEGLSRRGAAQPRPAAGNGFAPQQPPQQPLQQAPPLSNGGPAPAAANQWSQGPPQMSQPPVPSQPVAPAAPAPAMPSFNTSGSTYGSMGSAPPAQFPSASASLSSAKRGRAAFTANAAKYGPKTGRGVGSTALLVAGAVIVLNLYLFYYGGGFHGSPSHQTMRHHTTQGSVHHEKAAGDPAAQYELQQQRERRRREMEEQRREQELERRRIQAESRRVAREQQRKEAEDRARQAEEHLRRSQEEAEENARRASQARLEEARRQEEERVRQMQQQQQQAASQPPPPPPPPPQQQQQQQYYNNNNQQQQQQYNQNQQNQQYYNNNNQQQQQQYNQNQQNQQYYNQQQQQQQQYNQNQQQNQQYYNQQQQQQPPPPPPPPPPQQQQQQQQNPWSGAPVPPPPGGQQLPGGAPVPLPPAGAVDQNRRDQVLQAMGGELNAPVPPQQQQQQQQQQPPPPAAVATVIDLGSLKRYESPNNQGDWDCPEARARYLAEYPDVQATVDRAGVNDPDLDYAWFHFNEHGIQETRLWPNPLCEGDGRKFRDLFGAKAYGGASCRTLGGGDVLNVQAPLPGPGQDSTGGGCELTAEQLGLPREGSLAGRVVTFDLEFTQENALLFGAAAGGGARGRMGGLYFGVSPGGHSPANALISFSDDPRDEGFRLRGHLSPESQPGAMPAPDSWPSRWSLATRPNGEAIFSAGSVYREFHAYITDNTRLGFHVAAGVTMRVANLQISDF